MMISKLKNFPWGYLLFALLSVASGVAFFVFSGMLDALALTVGILLLVCGIIYGILTLSGERRGFLFFCRLFFAVAVIVGGILIIVVRAQSVGLLVSLIALFLIIAGSFSLQSVTTGKSCRGFSRWFLAVLAVLDIGGGYVLLHFTPDITVVPYLIGTLLVLAGLANGYTAWLPSKQAKTPPPCEKNVALAENSPEKES